MQSPAMADHLLNSTWNPYNSRFMNQPLAASMHAVVPQNYMPINPQSAHAETAMVRQLEDRISILQQQQFQDGLNAHFRNVQNSRALQDLQQQVQHMQYTQRSLSYDNSSLRFEIQNLRAVQDAKENEDCTRRIQLQPRSQEQKLESAMKNVNLMRIYAGVSLLGNATFEEVSLKGAEQMEALAKTLRSRVNRGGAAYLLEAEDAEAWAKKLREDAKSTQELIVDNGLPETPEVPVEGNPEAINLPNANVSDVNWDACLAQRPDESVEWNIPTRSKVATPSRRSHTPSAPVNAFATQIPSIPSPDPVWTFDGTASAKSWFAATHASRRSEISKALSSAVSIKIEETSEGNVSPVEIEVVPELQARKAAAPHQKYAAQQPKAPEDSSVNDTTEKDAVAVNEEPASNTTPENPEVESVVEEAQVPPKNATSSQICSCTTSRSSQTSRS